MYLTMTLTLSQANELVAQSQFHIRELTLKLEATQRQLATLQHQMEQMIRRLYGRKSEKLNPNQMMFDSIVLESLNHDRQVPQEPPAVVEPKVVQASPPVTMAAFPFRNTSRGWRSCSISPKSKRSVPLREPPLK